MSKITVNLAGLIVFTVLLSGCRTTSVTVPKLDVRAYSQDRLRVDQDITGNSGYVVGTPQVEDRSGYKNTRRVYVVEITNKNNNEVPVKKRIEEDEQSADNSGASNSSAVLNDTGELTDIKEKTMPPSLSKFDFEDTSAQMSSGEAIEYLVDKDDTLQKISKKFYDSYSKWPKIYEANKNVIKNPDFIQPGIKIIIPPLEKK